MSEREKAFPPIEIQLPDRDVMTRMMRHGYSSLEEMTNMLYDDPATEISRGSQTILEEYVNLIRADLPALVNHILEGDKTEAKHAMVQVLLLLGPVGLSLDAGLVGETVAETVQNRTLGMDLSTAGVKYEKR